MANSLSNTSAANYKVRITVEIISPYPDKVDSVEKEGDVSKVLSSDDFLMGEFVHQSNALRMYKNLRANIVTLSDLTQEI